MYRKVSGFDSVVKSLSFVTSAEFNSRLTTLNFKIFTGLRGYINYQTGTKTRLNKCADLCTNN